jgi:HD-GYP domain-containing protein (c-di-GMP phosphodiesterase class II)
MAREPVRLAELLGALSAVSDLARGRPVDDATRSCLVATGLARRLGLAPPAVADVYYTTLLRSVGCTATSHELAGLMGGDDVAIRARGDMVDMARPREAAAFIAGVGRGLPPGERLRAVAGTAARGKQAAVEGARADCEVGAAIARRLRLPAAVGGALLDVFERWDGRGRYRGAAGDEIAEPARFAAVALAAVMFSQEPEGAEAAVRRWRGRALDPVLADAFLASAGELLAEAAVDDPWLAVAEAEPEPRRTASAEGIDALARAFADAIDLKAPFLHGHSAGVASLAARAAALAGWPQERVTDLHRAGLLHDIGRAGIPTGLWEKPGPLSVAEWEQVRLHAYHSERILLRAPALMPLAPAAGMHHERIDGSGYHRGVAGSMLDPAARFLAAADAYHAMTEPRPHRPALTPSAAAATLAGMPLDRDAVAAVVEAAGHPAPAPRRWPAALTDREVEVLRLLAAGESKRAIAARLVLSPSTVHTHTVHIYAKTTVSTRAALAMWAMEHDLVIPGDRID